MRKTILSVAIALGLAVALSMSTISSARASIWSHSWYGQYHPYDPYWDRDDVIAFPAQSTATLRVLVHNPWGNPDLNVSAVKVHMDWNVNFSATEPSKTNPIVIGENAFHSFTIAFTVPYVATASNLFGHGYTIYVEEVDSTNASGPQKVSLHDTYAGYPFIVYSGDQEDAQRAYEDARVIRDLYAYYDFASIEAARIWENGTTHYDMGLAKHTYGDFAAAETHYEIAMDLMNNAILNETIYVLEKQQYDDSYDRQMDSARLMYQQANTSLLQAQAEALLINANATLKQFEILAQAALTQAYALIVFGIGFVVFGVAAVVWASKRPSP